MPPPANSSRSLDKSQSRSRVAKRSCNACVRCRRQKIKCSGSQPCEACKKRRLSCEFDERDQKVMVTKGYIQDLQQQIRSHQRRDSLDRVATRERAEGTHGSFSTEADKELVSPGDTFDHVANNDAQRLPGALDPAFSGEDDSTIVPMSSAATDDMQDTQHPRSDDEVASALTNPLTAVPSTFMTAGDGRAVYLGTSSNWSFTRRVLNMAHEYVHNSPVAPDSLLFDGTTYDVGWDGSRVTSGPDTPLLPSLDHVIYLMNAVKFHCGQIFHLFDEKSFTEAIYDFYAEPAIRIARADLIYIHLLLVVAFGKAVSEQKGLSRRPPGCDYFAKALQLLPGVHELCKEPFISAEILCCIALYFQCLDYRYGAHNFIGQAMRVALASGMHTSMPVQVLGPRLVERCRRIWWTIYIMDREMTSLMGLPQSLHDADIEFEFPTFEGSAHRSSALRMQVRLSQTIARINREVYGADGRLNKKFLTSTKNVLGSISELADELRVNFPLPSERTTVQGIPRMSAYLHLLYHQCIVLATRPLLFCFFKIQVETPETYLEALNSSKTVRNLIKLCMESSQQMISILSSLQEQGLLEKFLPFDLESLFVSTVNLILDPAVDPTPSDGSRLWLGKAYALLDDFARSGNLVAQLRRSELKQLDEVLSTLSLRQPQLMGDGTSHRSHIHHESQRNAGFTRPDAMPAHWGLAGPRHDDDYQFSPPMTGSIDYDLESGYTTAQMMDLANSIASSDTEWMQHAITEYSIW